MFFKRIKRYGLLLLSLLAGALVLFFQQKQNNLPSPTLGTVALVTKVHDGDTLTLKQNNKSHRVRLYGIDAPELDQPYGKASQRFLNRLANHQQVRLQVMDTDTHGRPVVKLWLAGETETLNETLVREGMAWWYPHYASHWHSLKELQSHAQEQRLGLWKQKTPTPPWSYRQKKRRSIQSPPLDF